MINKSQEEKDLYYMKLALDEARKAEAKGEIPIGAIIVSNNTILARAYNLTETLQDPSAHAEMQALTSATNYIGGKYLDKCTLYVTIEPCPMCAAALAWAQLGRLVFGSHDPKRGCSLFSPSLLHKSTKITYGVLEKECGELVSNFFKKLR